MPHLRSSSVDPSASLPDLCNAIFSFITTVERQNGTLQKLSLKFLERLVLNLIRECWKNGLPHAPEMVHVMVMMDLVEAYRHRETILKPYPRSHCKRGAAKI